MSMMEVEEAKKVMEQMTVKEQDAVAAYLLYLRLKRSPEKLKSLQQKLTSSSLEEWTPLTDIEE